MNYYEHHIRDYDAATSHLSWDEDMAYTRLLRWYYRKERPLPTEVAEVCRQVRATSKVQKDAVAAVLEEFFDLRSDGWHQSTCDEVIATFRAGEPEREAKKKNEETRLERHRKERSDLFAIINAAGQHRPWNSPISELRELARALQVRQEGESATGPATGTATTANETATQPATAPATPATATQTPLPIPHSPLPNLLRQGNSTRSDQEPARVSREAAVVMALKAEGIGDCNPGHPDLVALLVAGAEVQNFVSAARTAKGKHKGFAYVLGIVKGQLAEARQIAAAGRTATPSLNGSSGGAARAARMAEAVSSSRPQGDFIDMEVPDVTPRRLG